MAESRQSEEADELAAVSELSATLPAAETEDRL